MEEESALTSAFVITMRVSFSVLSRAMTGNQAQGNTEQLFMCVVQVAFWAQGKSRGQLSLKDQGIHPGELGRPKPPTKLLCLLPGGRVLCPETFVLATCYLPHPIKAWWVSRIDGRPDLSKLLRPWHISP